jgi:hypothetical protein
MDLPEASVVLQSVGVQIHEAPSIASVRLVQLRLAVEWTGPARLRSYCKGAPMPSKRIDILIPALQIKIEIVP